MGAETAILYFVYMWGLGFALNKLLRLPESESILEKNIMRTGTGTAVLVLLASFMNLARIPLDFRIFLVLAMAYPLYFFARNWKKITPVKFKIKKSDIFAAAAVLIGIVNLYIYATGAFSYPYLENDDPWGHALGSSYIAKEKTFQQSEIRGFHYMNPYPPSYNFIFGLLHQTDPSLVFVMKFINALMISLGIVYFYFFAAEFFKSREKGLFAAAVLGMVPAYMTHFIWAPVIAMMLFFPTIYCIARIERDRKWKYAAGVTFGALLISHPTHTIILAFMIASYMGIKALSTKDIKSYAIAGAAGIIASLSWWAGAGRKFFFSNVYDVYEEGVSEEAKRNIFIRIAEEVGNIFPKYSGTATRPYNFDDFLIAKGQNLINNPVGTGKAAVLLLLAGLALAPVMCL